MYCAVSTFVSIWKQTARITPKGDLAGFELVHGYVMKLKPARRESAVGRNGTHREGAEQHARKGRAVAWGLDRSKNPAGKVIWDSPGCQRLQKWAIDVRSTKSPQRDLVGFFGRDLVGFEIKISYTDFF